jgi:hypothetical protein
LTAVFVLLVVVELLAVVVLLEVVTVVVIVLLTVVELLVVVMTVVLLVGEFWADTREKERARIKREIEVSCLLSILIFFVIFCIIVM